MGRPSARGITVLVVPLWARRFSEPPPDPGGEGARPFSLAPARWLAAGRGFAWRPLLDIAAALPRSPPKSGPKRGRGSGAVGSSPRQAPPGATRRGPWVKREAGTARSACLVPSTAAASSPRSHSNTVLNPSCA